MKYGEQHDNGLLGPDPMVGHDATLFRPPFIGDSRFFDKQHF